MNFPSTVLIFSATLLLCASARTLEVGTGKQFARVQHAAAQAQPGDTILIRAGVYGGGDYISELQGSANAWITIRAATGESVIFRGGSQAMHLSDPAYLRIEGLVFEQQTANGVNIDDAGTFDTPAHHLIIENCEWRSINATGNNDELKLSGLDDFIIRNCRFANGSTGGSLVDMVGCHRGVFERNVFENGGSNCIQAKGGSSNIRIEGNRFLNGGQRAINIGGSTGLEFFRPQGINYEAKSIEVYSNIFVGSQASIAFVGAVECKVINNTIIRPTRWAARILQETTAPSFLPCGNNEFRNNIIVYGNTGTVAINVGANTAPETFSFSNNLWFNPDNASWSGPNTHLSLNPVASSIVIRFLLIPLNTASALHPPRGKRATTPRSQLMIFSGSSLPLRAPSELSKQSHQSQESSKNQAIHTCLPSLQTLLLMTQF